MIFVTNLDEYVVYYFEVILCWVILYILFWSILLFYIILYYITLYLNEWFKCIEPCLIKPWIPGFTTEVSWEPWWAWAFSMLAYNINTNNYQPSDGYGVVTKDRHMQHKVILQPCLPSLIRQHCCPGTHTKWT